MAALVLIGEPLLELSHPAGNGPRFGVGGDAFNTAVYLARLGHQPHLITAVGVDPYSEQIVGQCRTEGVQTGHVLRDRHRLPGLYAIRTDAAGERRFYYWRGDTAARAFFELPGSEKALEFAAAAGWLYLTGITLSIFNSNDRARLAEVAQLVREHDGEVVFDPNYRPDGWESAAEAIAAFAAFAPYVTVAMPTLDDENLLHGTASTGVHADRWRSGGAREVVIKCGAEGAVVSTAADPAAEVPGETRVDAIDTTGAGDSFNAAYLGARIGGTLPIGAAQAANKLAAVVVRHPGAVIPRAAMPRFGGGR